MTKLTAVTLADKLRRRRREMEKAKPATAKARVRRPRRSRKTDRLMNGHWRFPDDEVVALHARWVAGESIRRLAREVNADRAAVIRNFERLELGYTARVGRPPGKGR